MPGIFDIMGNRGKSIDDVVDAASKGKKKPVPKKPVVTAPTAPVKKKRMLRDY